MLGVPRLFFLLFAGSLSDCPERIVSLSLCKHRWIASPDGRRDEERIIEEINREVQGMTLNALLNVNGALYIEVIYGLTKL